MKIRYAAITAIFAAALLPGLTHAGWKLTWSDEFNTPGRPDPKKWGYEVGFVRNNESQYYTLDRRENSRVEQGMLVIEGRRESFPNRTYKDGSNAWQQSQKTAAYTSASLTTEGKAGWTYGRLEMRAKLPRGKGVWPAFWTLGDNIRQIGWPRCGEIDVMEFVGKDPDRIFGTIHFPVADGKHQSNGGIMNTKKPSDDFHLYAIEWHPDRIDFFFDKQKYHSVPLDKAGPGGGENPFRKPHYIILNLALGGEWGGPIDDKVLPQKYLIDYVRVYQWEEPAAKGAPGKKAPSSR